MSEPTNIRVQVRYRDADGEHEDWWPIERLYELTARQMHVAFEKRHRDDPPDPPAA
jgi:hypothetical protein